MPGPRAVPPCAPRRRCRAGLARRRTSRNEACPAAPAARRCRYLRGPAPRARRVPPGCAPRSPRGCRPRARAPRTARQRRERAILGGAEVGGQLPLALPAREPQLDLLIAPCEAVVGRDVIER